MLERIIDSIIKQDTTEQSDETFDGIGRAASLRSAQGGLDTEQPSSHVR